ncbi:NAD(P)H-dependent flavin oxidoreductase [Nocardia stercoris]|uniref:Nitronate monooxygenase n=1 Tax=Nocardia stercoris TaxID=2483361 RepID=A0A3M2KQB3_9NOCA|nr:nitronate monooxygenase [Nocardia stercoris]RMI27659.1 nitronate monooxygenase [Nocardia stercoris]
MGLTTGFTDAFAVRHPIALAPMGGVAGGALTAAVSEGGGFGILGAGAGDPEWLEREVAILRAATASRWGIGLLTWAIDGDVVSRVLEYRPAALMLSFGDPAPFAERVRAADTRLIVQVTTADETRRALDVGADLIVAQGSDAGGHFGRDAVGTMSFVPTVVDLAGATPVLAAGGIGDGRGLAAALALGAAGALVGTRFQTSPESLVTPEERAALLAAHAPDAEANRTFDIARGSAWPARFPARTLGSAFLDEWRGRDDELLADADARAAFQAAAARQDPAVAIIWAGQVLDRVTDATPAAELVATIVREAEIALERARR